MHVDGEESSSVHQAKDSIIAVKYMMLFLVTFQSLAEVWNLTRIFSSQRKHIMAHRLLKPHRTAFLSAWTRCLIVGWTVPYETVGVQSTKRQKVYIDLITIHTRYNMWIRYPQSLGIWLSHGLKFFRRHCRPLSCGHCGPCTCRVTARNC